MSLRTLHSLFKPRPSRQQRRRTQRYLAKRGLKLEKLEDRVLLAVGPQLIGINPNDGDLLEDGDIRSIAPLDLTFRFDDGQVIDLNSLDGIQITRGGADGELLTDDDIVIEPGFVGMGKSPNEVIFRFAETLPDDVYRIDIFGSTSRPLRNIEDDRFDADPNTAGSQDFLREFEIDLGAQVVAVVPQPISRSQNPEPDVLLQARNQIVVYFNDDDLLDDDTSAENPEFYQLIFTNDTATNEDDQVFHPTSVDYNAQSDTAVLTFAGSLESLPLDPAATSPESGRTYRLRIGTAEPLPLPPVLTDAFEDPGSSFDTATDLQNDLGFAFEPGDDMRAKSVIITSEIDPQPFLLDFPGSNNEPGHRQLTIAGNQHVDGFGADPFDGVVLFAYNFDPVFAMDAVGNSLLNQITERQKDRAREIFELYSQYLGVDFVETDNIGFTIAMGDFRSVSPSIITGDRPAAAVDISGFGPTVILDPSVAWNDQFGDSWFQEAMRQIGHLLGLGAAMDLPIGTIMGGDPGLTFGTGAEPVFPGDQDIVHGQHLFRPDGNDIDLYRFTLGDTGLFTAETIAERQANSSLLDSVLRLYRETDDGRDLIAQNDDYFSNDSFLEMELGPGTYYLGVSSTGNDQYDPTIENSGAGGTSQGPYDLRMGFRPDIDQSIVDADHPELPTTPLDGDADGRPGGVFNFWFRTAAPSTGQAVDSARTIFVDKSHTELVGQPLGTRTNPYNNIPDAFAFDAVTNPGGARPRDIVRIVGNGLDTEALTDDLPYEIGFDSLGRALPDGARMDIPQGVTVMVDAGAIFKLSRSVISVGSASPAIDRSGAALQVLGTPERSVFFTSINDETIGADSTPVPSTPEPGDWGGIVIREDVDQEEGRFVYDNEGIFLSTINQADIRYGGGGVVALQGIVNPIQIIDARPTISFNRIMSSADAAMSASPNSFAETNFHSPRFQDTLFTSDYTRVGPDIHGNQLVDNTTGGLFIRVPLLAGDVPQPMTVSGRWDDTDIVHVLGDNLILQGTPGGPVFDFFTGNFQARLDASLKVDPGTVVKAEGARIEAQIGADFYAEGTAERPVVFTSLQDDRFGAGGTFNSNNEDNQPRPGDWAGIIVNHTGIGSIDYAVIAYGGGINPMEGSFAGVNPIEIHQADVRITNTLFENNASGFGGLAPADRFGRGFNAPATIFVRGAQPIIVGNVFLGNDSPVVNINVNALNHFTVTDRGRATGAVDLITAFGDNQGPLVRDNLVGGNSINGMEVRGGTLTTESVWDDTDIVHVLRDGIFIPNFHTFGGLRLESSTSESLVVKLLGEDAGFTTTGSRLEIADHIGGRLQVVGQPDHPVVLTSLFDDTVGAGFDNNGRPQTDTNGGGRPVRSRPEGTFKIDLNFGPIISRNPEAMEAARRAASIWELQLQDPITIVVDVEMADLGAPVIGTRTPEILMQTTTERVFLAYESVRGALASDAGAHESIVKELPALADLKVNLPFDPINPFTVASNMQLTRANAQALGFTGLPGNPSVYDPLQTKTRDGQILINNNPSLLEDNDLTYPVNGQRTVWDFQRRDGLFTYREDFVSVFLAELGEILGFISSVDDVNAALDGDASRDIGLTPLDLFRFEPGRGNDDFTNAPRLLNPLSPDHVFFAGGSFDVNGLGLPIPGLETGDIPLAKGRELGDERNDFGAGHWLDDFFFRDGKSLVIKTLGVMDPISMWRDEIEHINDPVQTTQGLIKDITEQDREAFDIIGYDVVGGTPGDWQGILLEKLTHDGNSEVILEAEGSDVSAPGTNATPETAQFVGFLAPDLKSGDDNERLAFEIHGLINAPGDVDVYSFTTVAGTEVWIDVDRTSSALDSVVELIDANGTFLARSDDSPGFGSVSGIGEPLTGFDHYTTNPGDAGMRVVLPGAAGVTSTYLVRVRSSSSNLDGDLFGGLTSGQYQLQVRLQATDEVPGTSVQFADIRYADTGVRIIGPPIQSPLLGEQVEDESFNDARGEIDLLIVDDEGMPDDPPEFLQHTQLPYEVSAQHLGNLLTTDLGAISVFGNLAQSNDVDWYRIDVNFDAVERVAGHNPQRTAGVVFDIDYAAGQGRPNTTLSVFSAGGTLLFFSDGSNVPDDQSDPLDEGSGATDLSRGSVSQLDPYIGPVALSQGTYYVVVSSIAFVPFDIATDTATLDPIIDDAVNRGQRISNASGSSTFTINPEFPPGDTLSGAYQLEVRYAPVPVGGFTEANVAEAEVDKNRSRVQGQIIIGSNTIRDSYQWGIQVEDGYRDLPAYAFVVVDPSNPPDQQVFRGFLRTFIQQPDTQFTTGDYIPHGGAPRALPVLDEERIVPGLTLKNNVLAGGVEGGIHMEGDPDGIIIRAYNFALLDALFDDFSDEDVEGTQFTIWDNQRHSVTFEFDNNGEGEPGNILIPFDFDPLNDILIWRERFDWVNPPTLPEPLAAEIENAIRLSDLDVKVYRSLPGQLFVEGAIEIGHPDVTPGNFSSVFLPPFQDNPFPLITSQLVQQGPVSFARIVNNTLVGRGGDLFEASGAGDVGILLEDNVSPTLLNNIIANFDTGLKSDVTSTDESVDRRTFIGGLPIPPSSFPGTTTVLDEIADENPLSTGQGFNGRLLIELPQLFPPNTIQDIDTDLTPFVAPRPSVIGTSLYQGNLETDDGRVGVGADAILLSNTDPLFVDAENGNFLLDEGSRAIDSSINRLRERARLAAIHGAIGVAESDILAPDLDVRGQLRVDDPSVEPEGGIGENVFKDRGAFDRVDFIGPTAILIDPVDNDSLEFDQNPADTELLLFDVILTTFSIQLKDGVPPDPPGGTGTDDFSVTRDTVVVTQNDVPLEEGIDYLFTYDTTNDVIRLTSLSGIWQQDNTYIITLDNSTDDDNSVPPIRDLTGNPLKPNRTTGTTQFTIVLAPPFEGGDFGDAPPIYPTLLSNNGARHIVSETLFLGAFVDSELNGQASPAADGDDKTGVDDEDGVEFITALDVGFEATIRVTASDAGLLDAWIDFNGDGDWDDDGEQIFASELLVAGENSLSTFIPITATNGETFARFRLSSSGDLSPRGLAGDGEVEDYQVNITGSAWQNAKFPVNVNGSTDEFGNPTITPTDALRIINEINNPKYRDPETGLLPNPPVAPFIPTPDPAEGDPPPASFVDVNGDGFITPLDVLRVINFLNNMSAAANSMVSLAAAVEVVSSGVSATNVAGEDTAATSIDVSGEATSNSLSSSDSSPAVFTASASGRSAALTGGEILVSSGDSSTGTRFDSQAVDRTALTSQHSTADADLLIAEQDDRRRRSSLDLLDLTLADGDHIETEMDRLLSEIADEVSEAWQDETVIDTFFGEAD